MPDRFHIAAYLNEAVDKTRDNSLARSKYLWLKSPEAMTEKADFAVNHELLSSRGA